MSPDFVADFDSNARKTPVRVAFVTRRTSPAVKVRDEDVVMTHPEAFFRIAVAVQLLAVALVWIALMFDAPLEQLADPMHTPNPAKAPWYFLGLQELLHYFPPVVAGVLIPTLVVIALIVIPYFNINIRAEGLFLSDAKRRFQIVGAVVVALCVFLAVFDVWVALAPTVVVAAFMLAAFRQANSGSRRGLAAKPLSFWIMTWFLCEATLLTAVGTFFRGPGWSWVWFWRG
jgi:hypothetical protein